MKQLVCEMCGSTNLVKEGGVFVCQSCGCKYSVEDAKRMMIEGTVDVSGSTVMVDNSAYVERYLQNARRAYEKQDWEEVEKYYNLVEQNDPTNIEAIFYSSYGKARTTLVDKDFYRKQAAFEVLRRSVSVLDDNYDPSEREIVARVSDDIAGLYTASFVYETAKNGYGLEVRNDSAKTYALFKSVSAEFVETCINIANKCDKGDVHGKSSFLGFALAHAKLSGNAALIKQVVDLLNAPAVERANREFAENYSELEEEARQLLEQRKAHEAEIVRLEEQLKSGGRFPRKEAKAIDASVASEVKAIRAIEKRLREIVKQRNEIANKYKAVK